MLLTTTPEKSIEKDVTCMEMSSPLLQPLSYARRTHNVDAKYAGVIYLQATLSFCTVPILPVVLLLRASDPRPGWRNLY
jgi:hypothetical protein